MAGGGLRVGAGRPAQHVTVEDCRSIDIRQWKRDGLLDCAWSGAWWWRDPTTNRVTSVIGLRTDVDSVFVSYAVNRVPVAETIGLARTPCHFGGSRPWFQCPGCRKRVARLFLRTMHFRCPVCHDLRYSSQREDAIGRGWRAQTKLECLLLDSSRRPKGMHHATHARIADKIMDLEVRRDELLFAGIRRCLKAGY